MVIILYVHFVHDKYLSQFNTNQSDIKKVHKEQQPVTLCTHLRSNEYVDSASFQTRLASTVSCF
jgi:hypothetical protein